METSKGLDYHDAGEKTSRSSHMSYESKPSGQGLAARIRNFQYRLAGAIALTTFFVYLPTLHNAFVSWDDPIYVYENPHIRSFNLDFFRWIFLEFHAGNWHPLTWMSHAVDYAVWGLNPLGHHLTNTIFHAVNTFVVILLVMKLTEMGQRRLRGSERSAPVDQRITLITGGVTGLLFGLHPLHVESVAWVAERKDLLCALFFIMSIFAYVKYVSAEGDKTSPPHTLLARGNVSYFLCLVFFVFALLSKPMAVSLPFVLLIIDWYPANRIHSIRSFGAVLTEKIPFLLLSIGSSVLTVMAQKEGGAMGEAVPFHSRVLVASHSLVAYLWKMILPVNLIPYYPYPKDASLLSWKYLFAIALVAGITLACVATAKRQKLWAASWAYYVLTLIPVIGLVQVGGQSMADRYMYLPSLGPFLIAGFLSARVLGGGLRAGAAGVIMRKIIVLPAIILFVSMSYLTFTQTGIWKNGIVLWSYVIEKEPESLYFAYYNRGHDYSLVGQYGRAIGDYSKAIALNQYDPSAFFNRGLVFLALHQVPLARTDFERACELGDPLGCKALQNSQDW